MVSLIAPLEGTTDPQLTEYSICKNEAFSFQMAYKLVNTPADEGNEEETADTWRDGYYHTGDLAWQDEDGFYWYVGRADGGISARRAYLLCKGGGDALIHKCSISHK